MTFADKAAKAAGYRNPAEAMAALHALAKEVKTYEEQVVGQFDSSAQSTAASGKHLVRAVAVV